MRNDGDQLRRYCHIGTGNYNPKTARLYEDFGLLTSNPQVGEDVSNLFNVLSGYSMNTDYNRLLVAPHSVRTGLIARIDREITHQLEGRPSGVRIKCNSLVDEAIIDAPLSGLHGWGSGGHLGPRNLRYAPRRARS